MPLSEYTDVANCNLLLKHSTGVYSDAGTTPAADLDVIGQWSDQSGSGHHFTNTGASATKFIYSATGPYGSVKNDFYRNGNAGRQLNCSSYVVSRRSHSTLVVVTPQFLDFNDIYLWLPFGPSDSAGAILLRNGEIQIQIGATFQSTGLRPPTSGPCAILLVSSASGVTVYLNSIDNSASLGIISAGNYSQAFLGANTAPSPANYAEVVGWSRAVTEAEATDILDLAVSRNSIQVATPAKRLVIPGDSIPSGYGSTLNRNYSRRLGLSSLWGVWNFSQNGQTIADQTADFSEVAALDFLNDNCWLFAALGTNDFLAPVSAATMESRIQAFSAAALAAGLPRQRLILRTITGATDYNTWLRANYLTIAGRLIDVSADPFLGEGGSTAHPTYFVDAVHYSDIGDQRMAELLLAEVPELLDLTPVLTVTRDATEITTSDDAGSMQVGVSGVLTYALENTGTADTSNLIATITGTGATVTGDPADIAAAGTGSLEITLDTSAAASLSFVVTLSDDSGTLAEWTVTAEVLPVPLPELDEVWRSPNRRRDWTAAKRRRHWTFAG